MAGCSGFSGPPFQRHGLPVASSAYFLHIFSRLLVPGLCSWRWPSRLDFPPMAGREPETVKSGREERQERLDFPSRHHKHHRPRERSPHRRSRSPTREDRQRKRRRSASPKRSHRRSRSRSRSRHRSRSRDRKHHSRRKRSQSNSSSERHRKERKKQKKKEKVLLQSPMRSSTHDFVDVESERGDGLCPMGEVRSHIGCRVGSIISFVCVRHLLDQFSMHDKDPVCRVSFR